MKILMVLTARSVGGAEHYAEQLVTALADKCTFTLALSDHPSLQMFRQRLSKLATVHIYNFDRPEGLWGATRDIQCLADSHDVVHLNSNHPASRLGIWFSFALKNRRAPLICVEQRATRVDDIAVPQYLTAALPVLFRWSRRGVARIVAVSAENARTLTEYYHLPSTGIDVIPNGVEVEALQANATTPSTLRQELGLSEKHRLVLVLARLAPNKGHRFLVEAAPAILERHPNAHFVFAGQTEDGGALERRIAAADLTDKFSLLGSRADIVNLFNGSDVFVLPSLGEGFALSMIEALALGLPVVATRVGGAEEAICDGENGFLVPPADGPALARAINQTLNLDSQTRQQWHENARQTARRFSMQITAQKMLALYQQVARDPLP